MRRLGALAVAAAVLLMTGCGGSSNDDATDASALTEETSTSPDLTTPTVSTTSTETHATSKQYASVFAENSGKLRQEVRELNDYDKGGCAWTAVGQVDSPGYITCTAGIVVVEYSALTLAQSLNSADHQGAPAYIGPVPPEMEQLVDKTVTTARDLSKAAAAASRAQCTTQHGPGCLDKLVGFTFAMDDMQKQLDAWRPYL